MQVLLATAIVDVEDRAGAKPECRVLMDGGSQAMFFSEQYTVRLGLNRKKANVLITVIGNTNSTPA